MTTQQRSAIGCAIADLIGSYQAAVMLSDITAHDWEAHRQSIDDLLYTEKEPLTDELRNRIGRMDERFRKTYVTENIFDSAAEAVAFAKGKGYTSYTEEA